MMGQCVSKKNSKRKRLKIMSTSLSSVNEQEEDDEQIVGVDNKERGENVNDTHSSSSIDNKDVVDYSSISSSSSFSPDDYVYISGWYTFSYYFKIPLTVCHKSDYFYGFSTVTVFGPTLPNVTQRDINVTHRY